MAIFLVALALRVLSITELRSFPLAVVPLGDATAYLDWAGKIVEGDWLSRYLGVFYQAPLYPYFLALVAKVFGPGLIWPRLIQAVLGSLSAAGLVVAGRRFFSRPVGIVAGSLMATNAPAIFFDGLIGKTSLVVFAVVLFLVVVGRVVDRPTTIGWLLCGLILGGACLLRENTLLLVAAVAVWLFAAVPSPHLGRRLGWVVAFLCGVLLVLTPVGFRNLHVGGEFKLTTAQGGPNFYIGNNPDSNGSYIPLITGRSNARFERTDAVRLAESEAGRELSAGEVSRFWYSKGLDYISTEPAGWLRLSFWKLLLVFHRYEIPDTDDLELSSMYSVSLRILGLWNHFGVLVPLAVMGIVLTWGRGRHLGLLYLMLVVGGAGVAAFFVFARYRAPLIPVLVLFAAAGLCSLVEALRSREHPKRLVVAVVAGLIATVVVNVPMSLESDANRGMSYSNLGAALAGQDRVEEAIEMYREALRLYPGLTEASLNLGSTLLNTGRAEESVEHLHRAVEEIPDDPEVLHQLGSAYLMIGNADAAVIHLERALELQPAFPEAALALAVAHGRNGRWLDAAQTLTIALKAAPDNRAIAEQLVKLLLGAPDDRVRDPVRAVEVAEFLASQSEQGDLEVGRLLAMAYEASGRYADAVRVADEMADEARRRGQPGIADEIARWVAAIEERGEPTRQ